VLDVAIHDEVSGSGQAYCVVKMKKTNSGDVWRALNSTAGFSGSYAKICIAVDEDIDIRDPAMINWAISFNVIPDKDVMVVKGKSPGLDPSCYPPGVPTHVARQTPGSALLIDATRPWPYTPVSLPRKEFMERSKEIWEELGLPKLKPRMPWHGYSLGDWTQQDIEEAELALKGDYWITGEKAKGKRVKPS
jgi:3-polyprenyl-4-hydroxybenzoate decarboxylase